MRTRYTAEPVVKIANESNAAARKNKRGKRTEEKKLDATRARSSSLGLPIPLVASASSDEPNEAK